MPSSRCCTLSFILVVSFAANAQDGARIDSSTNESALKSWKLMLSETNDRGKSELEAAVERLVDTTGKEEGWNSLQFHMALSAPPVIVIKDKVRGLSAEQIIEMAKRTPAAR